MKKYNILILSRTSVWGGAEQTLIDTLPKIPFTFHLLTSDIQTVKFHYKAYFSKSLLHTSKYMRQQKIGLNPIKLIYEIYAIVKILFVIDKLVKQYHFDLIYGNNTEDIVFLGLYKFLFKRDIKVIAHIHSQYLKLHHKNGLALKLFYSVLDKIIIPSTTSLILLSKSLHLEQNKIEVVYNGIDSNSISRNFSSKRKEKYSIALVGNIQKRKQQEVFLSVAEQLSDKNIIFYLIGGIVDSQYFEQIQPKLKKLHNVKYLGSLKRSVLMKFYKKLDLLMLLSNDEVLPTVLLEAMSFGTLVLSRNVGGVKEIIQNNKNGFLIPYTISVDGIVRKVNDILAMDELKKKKISQAAIKQIQKKFSLKQKSNKIKFIIRDVLHE